MTARASIGRFIVLLLLLTTPLLLPAARAAGESQPAAEAVAAEEAQAAHPKAAKPEGDGVVGNTVWESIQKGGEVMYVILAASILGLMFVFEAAFRTRVSRILPNDIAKGLADGSLTPAALCADGPDCAIRDIVKAGYRWRGGTTEQQTEALEEQVDEWLWQLRRSVRPIGIIANTAPLLGLLGTVVGIIQAFDSVAREGALGDPGALAGGISKALLTTCFGLIVAIPLLLIYHWFMGRIEFRLRHCEQVAKDALILPPDTGPAAPKATTKKAAAVAADAT